MISAASTRNLLYYLAVEREKRWDSKFLWKPNADVKGAVAKSLSHTLRIFSAILPMQSRGNENVM